MWNQMEHPFPISSNNINSELGWWMVNESDIYFIELANIEEHVSIKKTAEKNELTISICTSRWNPLYSWMHKINFPVVKLITLVKNQQSIN